MSITIASSGSFAERKASIERNSSPDRNASTASRDSSASPLKRQETVKEKIRRYELEREVEKKRIAEETARRPLHSTETLDAEGDVELHSSPSRGVHPSDRDLTQATASVNEIESTSRLGKVSRGSSKAPPRDARQTSKSRPEKRESQCLPRRRSHSVASSLSGGAATPIEPAKKKSFFSRYVMLPRGRKSKRKEKA
eukprot:Selendium_serpulae@DN1951_c0_g1_i1.p1